jgi:hypothetical protein
MPQTSYIYPMHTYQSAAQCRFIRADARERANQHAPENNLISTNKELKRGEIKNGYCRLLAPPAILAFVLRSLLSLSMGICSSIFTLCYHSARVHSRCPEEKTERERVLAHKSGEI